VTRETALAMIRRQNLNALLVCVGRITDKDRAEMGDLLERAAAEDAYQRAEQAGAR
jgi:hypothetical protein